jgi:hypothetical protein
MQLPGADLRREGNQIRNYIVAGAGVCEVLQKPTYQKFLTTKMVLEVKRDRYGRVDKYKAPLVALACRQVAGMD